MRILGIETSCDETAASVVEDGVKILSNVVASSLEMHAKTGGIIPEKAAREQVKSIIPVIEAALADGLPPTDFRRNKLPVVCSQLAVDEIDAIAVTIGPGLIGSLLVGAECAKTLAYLWEKPLIAANHLVAHIYANWLETSNKLQVTRDKLPQFPALALVVSGGHTDLVLMRNHGNIIWLGGTKDDAAGEAFDKCARLLGLGYPGGPAISAAAEKYQIPNDKLQMFPRPLIDEDSFDFSFSGLKTAVLKETQKLGSNLQPQAPKLAAEVQEAIVDVLIAKSLRAIKKYKPQSFLLAGGVAANSRLRQKFQANLSQLTQSLNHSVNFFVPPPSLCTDNAAYVASCGYFNYHPINWDKINVDPGLTIADGGELNVW